jgi:hypothetical protein
LTCQHGFICVPLHATHQAWVGQQVGRQLHEWGEHGTLELPDAFQDRTHPETAALGDKGRDATPVLDSRAQGPHREYRRRGQHNLWPVAGDEGTLLFEYGNRVAPQPVRHLQPREVALELPLLSRGHIHDRLQPRHTSSACLDSLVGIVELARCQWLAAVCLPRARGRGVLHRASELGNGLRDTACPCGVVEDAHEERVHVVPPLQLQSLLLRVNSGEYLARRVDDALRQLQLAPERGDTPQPLFEVRGLVDRDDHLVVKHFFVRSGAHGRALQASHREKRIDRAANAALRRSVVVVDLPPLLSTVNNAVADHPHFVECDGVTGF